MNDDDDDDDDDVFFGGPTARGLTLLQDPEAAGGGQEASRGGEPHKVVDLVEAVNVRGAGWDVAVAGGAVGAYGADLEGVPNSANAAGQEAQRLLQVALTDQERRVPLQLDNPPLLVVVELFQGNDQAVERWARL